MRLLVLGGTVFLGRHLVEAALQSGHRVTMFNRGKRRHESQRGVELLIGDRDSDLAALAGRSWDAVVDTSGYFPRLVERAARMLAPCVEHYTFVSSVSVYADVSEPGVDEKAPVAETGRADAEDLGGGAYGPLKALCERSVADCLPGRYLNVRPGLIAGPHDASDRFTYWVRRAARGGAVLAPGEPGRPVQVIDVRDLARWLLSMIEGRRCGTYNAVGPRTPMDEVLASCAQAAGAAIRPVWADDAFLTDAGIVPWTGLPLWLPLAGESRGFFAIDSSAAIAAGLKFRPLVETAADTLAWDRTRGVESLSCGLSVEREGALVSALEQTKTPPE